MNNREKKFLYGLASMLKEVLEQKVRPNLLETRPELDPAILDKAVQRTGSWVERTVQSTEAFDAELILKRVPNLAFLELMTLVEYIIIAPGGVGDPEVTPSPDLQDEFRKMMYAFDLETKDKAEAYRKSFLDGFEAIDASESNGARDSFDAVADGLDS